MTEIANPPQMINPPTHTTPPTLPVPPIVLATPQCRLFGYIEEIDEKRKYENREIIQKFESSSGSKNQGNIVVSVISDTIIVEAAVDIESRVDIARSHGLAYVATVDTDANNNDNSTEVVKTTTTETLITPSDMIDQTNVFSSTPLKDSPTKLSLVTSRPENGNKYYNLSPMSTIDHSDKGSGTLCSIMNETPEEISTQEEQVGLNTIQKTNDDISQQNFDGISDVYHNSDTDGDGSGVSNHHVDGEDQGKNNIIATVETHSHSTIHINKKTSFTSVVPPDHAWNAQASVVMVVAAVARNPFQRNPSTFRGEGESRPGMDGESGETNREPFTRKNESETEEESTSSSTASSSSSNKLTNQTVESFHQLKAIHHSKTKYPTLSPLLNSSMSTTTSPTRQPSTMSIITPIRHRRKNKAHLRRITPTFLLPLSKKESFLSLLDILGKGNFDF